ncbi:hypothetical protein GUITHDRAFT_98228 [Guillardia theta CCMP2712]|uniref:SF4 helicase domain-containing protein n=1 Tax=Guillardia theta (strain CCMP2712) TaxID=905079 RepID=L1ID76_GUITC|nr:hypothetical protein GUITHDRAFT_98228 [Guillardia theta CCMP2712]EKX33854.1 hypothetical protein GUITHDRAFT_98228 [Guillardia theta CCMP2712]|eukprot:XP_005820834.1 hypothetical protein GUITHDRAFT_98228 [Guillardia theta CCMP2712]
MSVTFPWFSPTESELVRVKVRAIEDKKCMKLDPSGNIWGFFGWTTVSEDTTEIVLTEGEIDAMTVYQETGLPSLSLPNGASSLPVELIAMLERFQTIYLWMDDDVPGREGARMCLKKLGRHRCKVVWCRDGGNSGPKDANDALQKYEISTILSKAQIVPHDHILRFEDIRREIQEQLTSYNSISGISFGSALPTLTKILKGHRPGEFTIVTGRTGQGKTTMLSQLSIDLCEQGVHTLWGSFEIKNARLGAKMLQQHSKKSLRGCSDREFNDAADAFSQLPLWFLSYYGTTDIDDVLDAMEFAVYSKDVKHVVLDNLQFMTSGAYRESDTFKILDQAIHKLRLFATDFNVHISLVIHPRKDDESQLLTLSSIFGTAKATQESDNVIILQTNGAIKYLDIRKNRFDGSLGCVPFKFNEKTLRYEEMEPDEVLAMEQEYANSL